MFDEILSQWQVHRGLTRPPQEPIRLWAEQGRSLWIGNGWGPAVPYPAVDHGDGHRNHGYVRIKGNTEALARIPEAAGWPELAAFLTAINAAESPIESVGCEKGFFPAAGKGVPPVMLGSYFNVLFTDAVLNDVPESALLLSSRLLQAVEGCESWWSDIEIALERYRFVAGTAVPWGLMLRVSGYGRDESEARKLWGVTLDHLAKAVGELPHDFGWHQDRVSGAAA